MALRGDRCWESARSPCCSSGWSALTAVRPFFNHWIPGEAGFDTLVTGTAPTFWIFFCLTAAAVPWLRFREPDLERSFRCGVAVTPLLFGATSLYMLWSSIAFARGLTFLGLVVLGIGAVTYALGRRPVA
jgi:amino acid transporter